LGLAIACDLMRAHGGELGFAAGSAERTKSRLDLPARPAMPARAGDSPAGHAIAGVAGR